MGDDGGGSLISPDGVAVAVTPTQMVGVSAFCYLPLHHKSLEDFFWHRLTQMVWGNATFLTPKILLKFQWCHPKLRYAYTGLRKHTWI